MTRANAFTDRLDLVYQDILHPYKDRIAVTHVSYRVIVAPNDTSVCILHLNICEAPVQPLTVRGVMGQGRMGDGVSLLFCIK